MKQTPELISRRELVAGTGALYAAAQAGGQPVDSAGPSLGNLFDPIAAYGKTVTPSHSFLNPRFHDLETWKREAREVYRQRLGYSPAEFPLQAKMLGRERRNGYVQENLEIQATPYTRIPAVLLLP